jgi:hypothetical protein
VFRPNTLKYRGELRLNLGQNELAEADFRDAIAMAQRMSAKAWELRAATSMARLCRDQGKPEEARRLLAPVYGWFTDGPHGKLQMGHRRAVFWNVTGPAD